MHEDFAWTAGKIRCWRKQLTASSSRDWRPQERLEGCCSWRAVGAGWPGRGDSYCTATIFADSSIFQDLAPAGGGGCGGGEKRLRFGDLDRAKFSCHMSQTQQLRLSKVYMFWRIGYHPACTCRATSSLRLIASPGLFTESRSEAYLRLDDPVDDFMHPAVSVTSPGG